MELDELTQEYLYRTCKLKPLENLPARIIAIVINKYGVLFQAKYYLNGEVKTDYFNDFEVLLDERN